MGFKTPNLQRFKIYKTLFFKYLAWLSFYLKSINSINMKNLTISLFLFFPTVFYAQPTTSDKTELVVTATGEAIEVLTLNEPKKIETDPEIIELKKKLDLLEKKLEAIQTDGVINEKNLYSQNYNNFTNSINLINEINKTYKSLSADRKSAEAYNILISVNNPESEALGFKFTDLVIDFLETKVKNTKDLSGDDKTLFTLGIKKLIKGVASLINPTGLIGSAIQFISGFVPQNVKTAVKDPLGIQFIEDFKENIKNYRIYYATLDRYNSLFNDDLSNLDSKYRSIQEDISSYLDKAVKPTKIDINQPITEQINSIFNYNESGSLGFDHKKYNSDQRIKLVTQQLSELKNIVKLLNNYYQDYSKIVNDNFDRNIQLFDKASELPKAKAEDIAKLKSQLQELKDGKIDQPGKEGFSTKFQLNMQQIGNYIAKFQ